MSTLQQTEQTTPAAAAATTQVIYPKAGGYARMDSTGVEKSFLDSNTYAAAVGALMTQLNYYGI